MRNDLCDIQYTIKGRPPRLPFCDIKDTVLGKNYTLSLVFIGDHLSRRLNNTYRDKDKPTNILSFSLDKNEGEIFINLNLAKKQASRFGKTERTFIAYLFIHGLLHLKGMEHGSRMESTEKKILASFNLA